MTSPQQRSSPYKKSSTFQGESMRSPFYYILKVSTNMVSLVLYNHISRWKMGRFHFLRSETLAHRGKTRLLISTRREKPLRLNDYPFSLQLYPGMLNNKITSLVEKLSFHTTDSDGYIHFCHPRSFPAWRRCHHFSRYRLEWLHNDGDRYVMLLFSEVN